MDNWKLWTIQTSGNRVDRRSAVWLLQVNSCVKRVFVWAGQKFQDVSETSQTDRISGSEMFQEEKGVEREQK